MKILVCEPGKHPYVKDIEHTLENLQHEVDGYIQALYPSETDNIAVVCNEEGLFRDDLAWNRTVEKYGPIKGTFFVCGLGFEDFTGLTDEQIETALTRWIDFCKEYGECATFDAGFPEHNELQERFYKYLREMDRQGKLPVYVDGS